LIRIDIAVILAGLIVGPRFCQVARHHHLNRTSVLYVRLV
jgi:hypothetical protein